MNYLLITGLTVVKQYFGSAKIAHYIFPAKFFSKFVSVNRRCLILILSLLSAALSCTPKEEAVEYPENVKAMVFDEDSDIFVDFESYPEDLHRLGIGVVCRWADYLSALENIRDIDEYDNITGEAGKDGIPDFAGEHFTFIVIRDSSASKAALTAQCLKCSARLLNGSSEEPEEGRSKVVIVASPDLSAACIPILEQALALSGTKVTAIGLDDFTSRKAAAMTCYNYLREHHNLALRTTPQSVDLIVEPPFEIECILPETELIETDTLKCIPLP